MNYKAICLICFNLAVIFPASALEICGDIKQGEFLVFKDFADSVSELRINSKKYPITQDGYAIAAISRDEKKLIIKTDGNAFERTLEVAPTRWDIQKINGVNPAKVTPGKDFADEIAREQKDVAKALQTMQRGDYWREGFIEPLKGRISGNFGNQRIFNGIKKNPHSGTDIAAPEASEVKASSSGKVILSGKNYFYTGNMVIIDHGQGLQTIYAHLKEAKVNEGDEVNKGDVIGLVGHTGRATGPHLHWGASLNNIRFRPHSLLDINNKNCRKIK